MQNGRRITTSLFNTDACRDYIQRGALDEVEEIMESSGFDGMVTT